MIFQDQIQIDISGEHLIAHRSGAVFWPEQRILFLADLHLGKANHFRKEGIPIPLEVQKLNFRNLQNTLDFFRPIEVFFLGDLFHSVWNKTWDQFIQIIEFYPNTSFHLVEGNHDIMNASIYSQAGIQLHPEGLILEPFALYHHPTVHDHYYSMSGHLHPGIRLSGKGRQSLRMACFYFRQDMCVLPAFGLFTGKYICTPSKGDRILGLTEKGLIQVST